MANLRTGGEWKVSRPAGQGSSGESEDEGEEDFGLGWGLGVGLDPEGDLDDVILVEEESDGAGVSGVFKKELIAEREVMEVPAGTRRVEVTMIEEGGVLIVNADIEEVKIIRIAGEVDLRKAEHLKLGNVEIKELKEDGCVMCPESWRELINMGGAREEVEPKRLSASV